MVQPFFKPPKTLRKKKLTAAQKRPGMDPKHLECLRKLPSCLSMLRPTECHHLRVPQERGVGLRATDRWALPLTWDEHCDIHRYGSRREEAYFKDRGIYPYDLANSLWKATGDLDKMERIVYAAWERRKK